MKLINLTDDRIVVEIDGEDFTQDGEVLLPGHTINIPSDCEVIKVR